MVLCSSNMCPDTISLLMFMIYFQKVWDLSSRTSLNYLRVFSEELVFWLLEDHRDNGTRVNLDLFGQNFGLIYHAE